MMPVSEWKKTKLVKVVDAAWGDTSKTKSSYVESGFTAFSASGPDGFLDYFDYDQEGIVLSAIGANCGKVYFASGKWSCIKNTMRFLVKDEEELSVKFLFYALSNPNTFVRRGSGQPFIRQQDVRDMEISYPPLPEQQKIIEILEDHLSRLDAALADVKQAKLKAAQFRRSLLQAAFTGNLTGDGTGLMNDIPAGWEIKHLEDLCDPGKHAIVDGPFGSNLKRSDYVESGIPVLKIQNIKENVITLKKMDYVNPEKYEELLRHSFAEGDIVMTKLGDPLGVSAIVNGIQKGLIVADLVRIRPSKILTKFLCYQLNSPRIQKYINEQQKGTTRPRVNLAMIRELPIYSPPLDEQHRILEILEDHLSRLEASVAIADAMEKQTASLRRSLLQAAFTGQLTKEVASV